MAQMLPPQVYDRTISGAERQLFEKIRGDLDGRWTVLHSLGFIGHPRKPWAEIDFILIGPPGVFCLEVKGGRISRESGAWLFTNRTGQITKKSEGPFEQVGSATAVMRKFILDRLPDLRRAPIQYCVATPDIEWTIDGPDTPKILVFDSRDLRAPFSAYMDRIVEYWQQWLRDTGRRVAGLNSANRHAAVRLLRGDFDLRPSLSAQLGLVETELMRLTEQQFRTMEGLRLNDRSIIRGGAGTGKTMLAVNEARREADMGRNVLLVCFNRRLAEHLSRAFHRTSGVTVRHLHGLMAELVGRARLQSRLPDTDESSLFEEFYPELAAEALVELNELRPFDTLVVDEGQDLLLDSYLDLFDFLVAEGLSGGRWRIFLDHRQNIYGANVPKTLNRLREHSHVDFELTLNCRNTAPIAMATSLFAETPLYEISEVEGPEVMLTWYGDAVQHTEVLGSLLDQLIEENIQLNQVVVLSPKRLENSEIPRRLPNGTVLWQADQPRPGRRHVEFSTIASFKGLEREAVIVAGVDNLRSDEARTALYVGLSRAKGILAAIIAESQRDGYEELSATLGQRIAAQPASREV